MALTTKLYTADDLWQMPGDEPWELWDGELLKVPGAGAEASETAGIIFVHLFPFVRAAKLGIVTTADGEYVLARDPDTVVVPDVGYVRWDRLPGGVRPRGHVPVPPDLAVEVRSPSDRAGGIAAKLNQYRRAQVPLVWWIDPVRRTVAVYRYGELVGELREGDALDGEDVLPGFRMPVATVFA